MHHAFISTTSILSATLVLLAAFLAFNMATKPSNSNLNGKSTVEGDLNGAAALKLSFIENSMLFYSSFNPFQNNHVQKIMMLQPEQSSHPPSLPSEG